MSADLARRIELRTAVRIWTANLTGAALAFVYFGLLIPRDPRTRENLVALGVIAASMVIGAALGYVFSRRVFVPLRRWLGEARPPDPDERRAVLEGPRFLATGVLAWWLVGALVFGALNWWFGSAPALIVRVVSGVALAGAITSTLVFLLVERVFRPAFALALAGGPPGGVRTPGIRARLALSWVLGSSVPLLAIAAALFRPDVGEETRVTEPIAFMVGIGLAVGGLLTATASRSLIDPLTSVRSGMERVESGDVRARLEVDDGGEIGQLQAGFNRMVEGLAERARLHDLFGRHVGTEVARQALEREPLLVGERLEVSVLFVDLADSTRLVEDRTPVEVVALLNEFFSVVVRTVEAEGGWVNKFEGDGALCVFGAPSAHADHAARALRAARRLASEIDRLSARRPELTAGIGVSSGPVVAGNVGAEQRYEYTVVGDPVHEAARLTELAKVRGIRVAAGDAPIRRAGDEAREWTALDPVLLRGRTRPTGVYTPATG